MNYEALHEAAHRAGMEAGNGAIPQPMVVVEAGIFDEPIPGGNRWTVPEGVCGFAWINIRDARKGFARWAKKVGVGRTDRYFGGVTIWVSAFGQSMTRKEAYALAYAYVLQDAGINAYSNSRMD